MLSKNKFLIDNIDIAKGAITTIEEKIIQDDDGKYINNLKKMVEQKLQVLNNSDYKHKKSAIAALQAFIAAATAYRSFIEERKQR